jgi:antitoxin component YwqK of YwqJK toxin-antitoxin module
MGLGDPAKVKASTERYTSKPDGDWIYYDTNGKEMMRLKYKEGVKL